MKTIPIIVGIVALMFVCGCVENPCEDMCSSLGLEGGTRGFDDNCVCRKLSNCTGNICTNLERVTLYTKTIGVESTTTTLPYPKEDCGFRVVWLPMVCQDACPECECKSALNFTWLNGSKVEGVTPKIPLYDAVVYCNGSIERF